VQDGDRYKFYVVGKGAKGFKRDPYARELTTPADFPGTFGFPACDCVVRNPTRYQWRSEGFRPPAFNDLIIYQFHVGVFSGPDSKRHRCEGTFLDALDKVEHLVRLGVSAIEPLPIDEAGADRSIGYDGRDFFSPEMAFGVPNADLMSYLPKVNALFAAKGKPGVGLNDLVGSMAQLKVMIDIFHLHDIAVILDVVYNHAGPFIRDDDCLYFFDLRASPSAPNKNDNDSLYFTDQGVGGGLAFAYWNQDVRQFLIDNGRFFYDEYRVDGLRFEQPRRCRVLSGSHGNLPHASTTQPTDRRVLARSATARGRRTHSGPWFRCRLERSSAKRTLARRERCKCRSGRGIRPGWSRRGSRLTPQ
jgi:1,4-alpha-glucan branching enzyme